MNATTLAEHAYGQSRRSMPTPRGSEYEAFAHATRRLVSASNAPTDITTMAHALHENRRLWTVIAASVADESNALPEELRAQIFYLSEYVQHHSRDVLKGNASVDALIDINQSMMQGLRGIEGTA